MKKRKTTKLWVVLALVISLVAVQTVQIIAEASDEDPVTSDSPVIAGTVSELISAVENAADGDVIGIDSEIVIDTNVGQIGSNGGGKHITILRMGADGCFNIAYDGNVTFSNITFEGNNSNVVGNRSLFLVMGIVNMNDVVIQNHSTAAGSGGAAFVETTGVLNADRVVFDGNTGYQGGHIFTRGSVSLRNCTLRNGVSSSEAGAVMVSGNGMLDMTGCKVYRNVAASSGGGIHNNATATLTRCAFFANTAAAGADIANDTSVKAFNMDSIAEASSLYEEEGITPIEWVLDSEGYTEDMIFHFDLSNPSSLMKLVYEDNSAGGNSEGEGGGDNTGDGGDTSEGGDNTGDGAIHQKVVITLEIAETILKAMETGQRMVITLRTAEISRKMAVAQEIVRTSQTVTATLERVGTNQTVMVIQEIVGTNRTVMATPEVLRTNQKMVAAPGTMETSRKTVATPETAEINQETVPTRKVTEISPEAVTAMERHLIQAIPALQQIPQRLTMMTGLLRRTMKISLRQPIIIILTISHQRIHRVRREMEV